VLSGQTKTSPHRALFYFNGRRLEAVRSGPWKLAIAPQGTGLVPGAAQPVKHTGPRLYNLDADVGELTDVAAQNPGVVERLKKLVQQMDADLGATGEGPGVRPPDRVANPQPLLKRVGMEYD
jgi:arylsulfatase A